LLGPPDASVSDEPAHEHDELSAASRPVNKPTSVGHNLDLKLQRAVNATPNTLVEEHPGLFVLAEVSRGVLKSEIVCEPVHDVYLLA